MVTNKQELCATLLKSVAQPFVLILVYHAIIYAAIIQFNKIYSIILCNFHKSNA